MGWSKADVFAVLLAPAAAERATEEFAAAYEALVAADAVAEVPGALGVLRTLRERGVKVCLTTGFAPSTRDALVDALGWWEEIDLALSPADVGRGRPAPDLVLGAMARLGVAEPRAVAVVGDTVSDLEAGSAARCRGGRRRAERRPRQGHARGRAAHGDHRRRERPARRARARLTPDLTPTL